MIFEPCVIGFIGSLGAQELTLILLIVLVFAAPCWIICKKAGLSPWLSLLVIVPFGVILLPWLIALLPWKTKSSDPVTLPPEQ